MKAFIPASFCGVFVCLFAPLAAADDADDLYRSVYEPKVKQALTTPDRKDDAALAGELLVAARSQKDLSKLAILLADKAVELTFRDPAALATAADGLSLLIELDPPRKAERLEKLIDVRQRQFTAAKTDSKTAIGEALIEALLLSATPKVEAKDFAAALPLYRRAVTTATLARSEKLAELKATVELFQRQQKAMEQVSRLRERILGNAGDLAAIDELVRVYIIDLDAPDDAIAYANRGKDPALKEFVALATKRATDLTAEENLKLGDWYRSLAANVADDRKATPLIRAKECYQSAMESAGAADLTRRKADLLGKEVEAALAKLETPARALPSREPKAEAAQWTEITPLIDLAKDVGKGNWVTKKNSLILMSQSPDDGNSYFNFPLTVKGPYEWQIQLEAFTETDGFRFVLPVGERHATMVIGGGTFIEYAVDPDPAKPTSRSGFKFTQGKTHQMQFIVKPDGEKATIVLMVDRKVQLQWTGDATKLPGGNRFGLVPWNHKAAYHEMKVRPLPGGEIKRLREPATP